jgi:hypothetical protein
MSNFEYIKVYDEKTGNVRKFEKENKDIKKIPINKEAIKEIAKDIMKK